MKLHDRLEGVKFLAQPLNDTQPQSRLWIVDFFSPGRCARQRHARGATHANGLPFKQLPRHRLPVWIGNEHRHSGRHPQAFPPPVEIYVPLLRRLRLGKAPACLHTVNRQPGL